MSEVCYQVRDGYPYSARDTEIPRFKNASRSQANSSSKRESDTRPQLAKNESPMVADTPKTELKI